MPRFHLQVCHREWVLWGYGKRLPHFPRFACNVSPAVAMVYDAQDNVVARPFQLPLPSLPNPLCEPQEYERVTMWGWRWVGENEINSTRWRLADSKSACIEWAHKDVAHQLEYLPHYGRALRLAVQDVREHSMGAM